MGVSGLTIRPNCFNDEVGVCLVSSGGVNWCSVDLVNGQDFVLSEGLILACSFSDVCA